MNYITIEKLEDLNQLLEVDIYLTGKLECMQEELEYNTWGIMFDTKLVQELSVSTLKSFMFELINKRSEQVEYLGLVTGATFYMWFDEMSCQLCFDVLSGRDIKLPFRCTVRIVKNCETILKTFLEEAKEVAKRGSDIGFEDIKFLEPGDEGFGEIEEQDPKSFIQEVYVTTIP